MATRLKKAPLVVLILPALLGCGEETGQGHDPDAPFPDRFTKQSVAWRTCPLDDSTGEGEAECADMMVPVRWAEPDGATITLRIKRREGEASAVRQLWLHEGGPGGSSVTDFGPFVNERHELFPGTDYYMMDHRGTGDSAFLECPEEYRDPGSEWGELISNREWGLCAADLDEAGPGLDAFSVSEAARDTAFVASLFGRPDRQLFHYGVSYGTLLLTRYAMLFPQQPDGVILDSVVTPDLSFAGADERADVTAGQIFDLCADDPVCSSKLGDRPAERARDTLADFVGGHCPEVAQALAPDGKSSPTAYLQIVAYILGTAWEPRRLIPVLYYRLERCSDDDVAALKTLFGELLGGEPSVFSEKNSSVLFHNIALSELSDGLQTDPATAWQMNHDNLVSNYIEYRLSEVVAHWPVYMQDEHHGGFPGPEVPLLGLNGTLDLQTPIEIASGMADLISGPLQHFVVVPDANHAVLIRSPVKTEGAPDCGAQIVRSFLANPTAPPDTSCFDDLKPVDFSGDPQWSGYLLGTADTWGDGPPPPRLAPARAGSPPVALLRWLARSRQLIRQLR